MRNYLGEIVGVIQLINHKPDFELVLESPAKTEEVVTEFTDHHEHVLAFTVLASRCRDRQQTTGRLDSKPLRAVRNGVG